MWLTILGMIPGLLNWWTKFQQVKFDARVKIISAKIGGDTAAATEIVKLQIATEHENTSKLAIIASNPLLVFLLVGFAFPLVVYSWKVIIVDKVIGPGCIPFVHACWIANTDPLGDGDVAKWATTIISFLFGSTTTMALGKMWLGRNKADAEEEPDETPSKRAPVADVPDNTRVLR